MKSLKVPFQIDSRGGLAYVEDTRTIVEQQIADILVTAHYERVMNPAYGAGLPEFVFTSIRSALLTVRASEIKSFLNDAVELAEIVSVSLSGVPGHDSSLAATVAYSIGPSPQVFTMTKTVTGMVTTEVFGAPA